MSDEAKRDEAPEVVQEEYAKRREGRLKRHCRRFWWLHLLIFIIIAVVAVLLIIFVAIPKIAQQKINEAQLTIQGITVTQTQSDNYTMSINSTITSDGSVHATIDAFTGQMYLEDLQPHTPFAAVNFPQTTSDALVIVNITNQFTPVTDLDAFTVFNTWLLTNDSLRVTVTGNTNVHISGISKAYGVTFTKTVTMPGLRGFEGTNVTQGNISLTPDADGNNFRGFVTIPNYSLINFEIGNASFHNYLLGQEIGTAYVDNIFLVAGGLNNFSMRANITQTPVITALGEQPYCTNGGVLPFQLRGKNVTNNGQFLSYYANALASNNQTVDMGIGADLKQDLNITIPCSQT